MHDGAQTMRDVATRLVAIFEQADDAERTAMARLLLARVALRQAYVTLAGETSSGKSSLINGLFGRRLLPVGGGPTTATVAHVMCRDEPVERYFAIFRDATQQELDRDQFVALNAAPPADLLRLQVRARPAQEADTGLHLFDTPGYNSIVAAHQEVLEEFLPQSDVVVFVVGYRAGFGQESQDLLDSVAAHFRRGDGVPVILVINRAPTGVGAEDRRVVEILANARDCLGASPPLFIIASCTSNRQDTTALPATEALWRRVAALVAQPERQAAVESKLCALLRALIDDADDDAERAELALRGDAASHAAMVEVLVGQRAAALAAIDRTIEGLSRLVPRHIEMAADRLRATVTTDIQASDKWLGSTECAEWVTGHLLPFEVRAIARSTEAMIAEELQRLDEDLSEIANTAVADLQRRVTFGDDAGVKLAANLVRTLVRRLAEGAWRTTLRNLGGVGGTTAGLGNLAKMAVSRAGNLVGTTFSREVYKQIGRTFTKQMVQRINVIVTVVVEALTYLYKSNTWQSDLVKQVSSGIGQWRREVVDEVLKKHLPDIRAGNQATIGDIFDDLIAEYQPRENNDERIAARRQELQRLRTMLAVGHA